MSPQDASPLRQEAVTLSRYLIGREPDEHCVHLYVSAMRHLEIVLQGRESRMWDFMMRNPWVVPAMDAALAIRQPHSNIRRKIFTMLAILEASPKHAPLFLPAKQIGWRRITVVFAGIRAVVAAVLGCILLLFL